MIKYPNDREIKAQSHEHDIPTSVLVRDLVRIVEVQNLTAQNFFGKNSVLAGSMALRCFGSPRFTVYDADFSTSEETVRPPTQMKTLLRYQDDDLEIEPADLVPHDELGTAWQSAPIKFMPAFTSLVPNPDDREFKADVSFRGLLLDGIELPLRMPYTLDIWEEEPTCYVMDPHETVAEKILGWCAHRLVKHYADLAFIAIVSHPESPTRNITLNYKDVRSTLADKLEAMAKIQPGTYAQFPDVNALIADLAKPPKFDRAQWLKIMYIRAQRDRFTQEFITQAVREILARNLRETRTR